MKALTNLTYENKYGPYDCAMPGIFVLKSKSAQRQESQTARIENLESGEESEEEEKLEDAASSGGKKRDRSSIHSHLKAIPGRVVILDVDRLKGREEEDERMMGLSYSEERQGTSRKYVFFGISTNHF